MKVSFSSDGVITLLPEDRIDAWALKKWWEIQDKKTCDGNTYIESKNLRIDCSRYED